MSSIEIINPGTPVAGPYSPGIKAGNLLFVSGQGSAQPATDIKEQTLAVLTNIKKIVEATGGKISNIVNTTVFLKNIKEFSEMNSVYKKFFNDNGVSEFYPARATVEVSNLPLASMLIEISAIVAL
ncbi:MAG: reactive intermediate/imine deaminase [Promethearchaeota archaeon Loki_b31]|nr:MAG: reactive intermediate/imine deaminase [Candidatus Lokiarchaeota archaeon Loki_b31]